MSPYASLLSRRIKPARFKISHHHPTKPKTAHFNDPGAYSTHPMPCCQANKALRTQTAHCHSTMPQTVPAAHLGAYHVHPMPSEAKNASRSPNSVTRRALKPLTAVHLGAYHVHPKYGHPTHPEITHCRPTKASTEKLFHVASQYGDNTIANRILFHSLRLVYWLTKYTFKF
jgi:hypothetical protein